MDYQKKSQSPKSAWQEGPKMSRRRRPSEEADRSGGTCSSSGVASTGGSTNPLAGFFDRMFCCSYSGDQIFMEEAPDLEYVGDNSLVLDGSMLSERALRYFPSIELAHELRSSSPCKASSPAAAAEFIFPEDKLHSPANKLRAKHQFRGDGSTATTESSCSSIHSWNTLPTQSSDESCFSLPEYHVLSSSSATVYAAAAAKAGVGAHHPPPPPPPYKYHQRTSTDPDLAETLLLQQIQAAARQQQIQQQVQHTSYYYAPTARA